MKIQDLVKAWEQAVDDATIEQKRTDEMANILEEIPGMTMLNTRTGLRAGYSCSPNC